MGTVLHPHAAYVIAPQPQELPETLVPMSTGPGAHNNRTQPDGGGQPWGSLQAWACC